MIYLLKLNHEQETFYKVGRTCDINRRMKELRSYTPYNIELLWISPSGIDCDSLEYWFHKDMKRLSYKPKYIFNNAREYYKEVHPSLLRSYLRTNRHLIRFYDDKKILDHIL